MASVVAARRYARAAFELALDLGTLDRWEADLKRAASLLADHRVMAYMLNPKVLQRDKQKAIGDALGSVLDPLVVRFLSLLVQKDRITAIATIAEQFERLLLEHRGIVRARVTTAVGLDPGDRAMLEERLEQITQRKVELETQVDPEIMGGLIARIGDKVIDGSTRSRLVALKASLGGMAR